MAPARLLHVERRPHRLDNVRRQLPKISTIVGMHHLPEPPDLETEVLGIVRLYHISSHLDPVINELPPFPSPKQSEPDGLVGQRARREVAGERDPLFHLQEGDVLESRKVVLQVWY